MYISFRFIKKDIKHQGLRTQRRKERRKTDLSRQKQHRHSFESKDMLEEPVWIYTAEATNVLIHRSCLLGLRTVVSRAFLFLFYTHSRLLCWCILNRCVLTWAKNQWTDHIYIIWKKKKKSCNGKAISLQEPWTLFEINYWSGNKTHW